MPAAWFPLNGNTETEALVAAQRPCPCPPADRDAQAATGGPPGPSSSSGAARSCRSLTKTPPGSIGRGKLTSLQQNVRQPTPELALRSRQSGTDRSPPCKAAHRRAAQKTPPGTAGTISAATPASSAISEAALQAGMSLRWTRGTGSPRAPLAVITISSDLLQVLNSSPSLTEE